MFLALRSLDGLRCSRMIAILGSSAASLTIGITFLELDLDPLNIPDAIVYSALFFQPALLMILSPRRRPLSLAAGIIAAFLGSVFFLVPFLFFVPQFSMVGLFMSVAAIAAFIHLGMTPTTKGDGKVAFQAVVVTVLALIASGISNHPMCRASAMESFCVDDATSYVGAAAAVVTLWLGTALLWLVARKPLPTSPATIRGRE